MDDADKTPMPQFDEDDDFPPPRRRPHPAAVLGLLVLIALVIGGAIFAVARFTGGQGQNNANAVPTPTLVPGSNLFYVQTTPVWGTIVIDGQVIVHPPTSGDQSPVALSAGVHQVVWRADPFKPQQCTIIVPPIVSQTVCLTNDVIPVNVGPDRGLSAYVITFTLSITNLSADRSAALIQAAQTALDHLSASDTVQPGERYADLNAPQFVATATSALRATMHFQLDTDPNDASSCLSGFLGYGSTCDYNGQNCHTFCTLQEDTQGARGASPANRWDVFAVIKTLWDYSTLNGQLVAQNQPDETDNAGYVHLINLYITWDGSQWHVATSVPGNTTNFLTPGAYCVTASDYVTIDPTGIYYAIPGANGSSQPIYWNSQQASNPAAGCLLTAYVQAGNSTPVVNPQPVARCLYRFGVMLALDTATHNDWQNLPLANAYEQGIAQQIAAQK